MGDAQACAPVYGCVRGGRPYSTCVRSCTRPDRTALPTLSLSHSRHRYRCTRCPGTPIAALVVECVIPRARSSASEPVRHDSDFASHAARSTFAPVVWYIAMTIARPTHSRRALPCPIAALLPLLPLLLALLPLLQHGQPAPWLPPAVPQFRGCSSVAAAWLPKSSEISTTANQTRQDAVRPYLRVCVINLPRDFPRE